MVEVLGRGNFPNDTSDALTMFVRENNVTDIRMILTMDSETFREQNCELDFLTLRSLKAINMWYHESKVDQMSDDDEFDWFMKLTKNKLMRYCMKRTKVTELPKSNTPSVPTLPSTPGYPQGSNKLKLEQARRSSMAIYASGRPPLPPGGGT